MPASGAVSGNHGRDPSQGRAPRRAARGGERSLFFGLLQCTRLRQGATATGMEGVVPLPTAMTHINPGHVGLVIHRVSGRMDPTPLGSTH